MQQFAILTTVITMLVVNYALAQRGVYNPNNLNNVPILKQSYDLNPDGSYYFDYQTGNGIQAQEQGNPKNADTHVKQGSFSYTGDDGAQYAISYIADENGFNAQGAHLPTAPPIPVEIQKALAYNAAHPEEDADGIVRGGRGYGR